ncbi:MAG: PQQ-binding-like beta-propeller repeat protein [Myxococcota bacterium]
MLLGMIVLGPALGACAPEAENQGAPDVRPAWKRDFQAETTALAADGKLGLLAVATAEDVDGRGEDHLYVLDAQGTVLWHAPMDQRIAGTVIARDGSIVLAYLVDGRLLAWSPHGEKRWEKNCVGIPEVSASGDRIVCSNTGEETVGGIAIEALDASGKRLWSFDDPGGIWRMALADDGGALAAITLAGYVVAINGDGRVLWREQLDTPVGSVAMSSGEERKIAVGTGIEGESLWVYDLDGAEIWRATVPGGADSIALSRNAEFLVTGNNTVLGQRIFMFDRAGKLGWKFQLDRPAREPLRMGINDAGDRIVAVLEEEGQPTLLAWDGHGDVTARMRAGADILDYVLSDTGTRLAAMTGGGKVAFYTLEAGKGHPASAPAAESGGK